MDIYLTLAVGSKTLAPAPVVLLDSIRSVRVHRSDRAPNGFEIVLGTHIDDGAKTEQLVFDGADLLSEGNLLRIGVEIDLTTTILLDGVVTRRDLRPAEDVGEWIVTVLGEDFAYRMDQIEIADVYANLKDEEIVTKIAADYATMFDCSTTAPANAQPAPLVSQRCTDLLLLQRLARRNGYRLFLKPPASATAKGTLVWGPRDLAASAQPALTAPHAPLANVETMNAKTELRKRAWRYGQRIDQGQEVAISSGYADTRLSSETLPAAPAKAPTRADAPALIAGLTSQHGQLIDDVALAAAATSGAAQGQVDNRGGGVVRVTGKLDTRTYGQILQAPGIVGVRGLGNTYDADYYVESVEDCFDFAGEQASYAQEFVLIREGQDAKGSTV